MNYVIVSCRLVDVHRLGVDGFFNFFLFEAYARLGDPHYPIVKLKMVFARIFSILTYIPLDTLNPGAPIRSGGGRLQTRRAIQIDLPAENLRSDFITPTSGCESPVTTQPCANVLVNKQAVALLFSLFDMSHMQ